MRVALIQGHTDKTTRQVAQLFAETHWPEPRKIINWNPANTVESSATFSLVNGMATYRIFFNDGWHIERV